MELLVISPKTLERVSGRLIQSLFELFNEFHHVALFMSVRRRY